MGNFSNQAKRFRPIQPTYNTPIPGTMAKVTKFNRKLLTCEVQTISGDTHRNVRLLGPALNTEGNGYGRFNIVKKNQLVFIGYVMGVQTSPVIIQAYPFSARDEDFNNLKNFISKYPEIQEDEFVDFHDSGYCVRYKDDMILFQDKTKIPLVSIDMISGNVLINTFLQVKNLTATNNLIVGAGIYPAVKSPSLSTWITDMYNCLNNLKTAINSAVPVPSDGGAALKAAMVTALNSVPPPTLPPDLFNTNSTFGPPAPP